MVASQEIEAYVDNKSDDITEAVAAKIKGEVKDALVEAIREWMRNNTDDILCKIADEVWEDALEEAMQSDDVPSA